MKCKWCNKSFQPRRNIKNRQKFCAIVCREEYHSFNDKRSPFYRENKTKKEILSDKDKFVECKICGQLARRRLSTHIKKRHNLTWKEYISKYPNAVNECGEVKKFSYDFARVKGKIIRRDDVLTGWESIKNRRIKKVGEECELCGFNKYKEALTGHHRLPKFYGGKDRYNNCVVLCENCHRHIHKLIFDLVKTKNYTIEDIVRTCVKAQEVGSKSLR